MQNSLSPNMGPIMLVVFFMQQVLSFCSQILITTHTHNITLVCMIKYYLKQYPLRLDNCALCNHYSASHWPTPIFGWFTTGKSHTCHPCHASYSSWKCFLSVRKCFRHRRSLNRDPHVKRYLWESIGHVYLPNSTSIPHVEAISINILCLPISTHCPQIPYHCPFPYYKLSQSPATTSLCILCLKSPPPSELLSMNAHYSPHHTFLIIHMNPFTQPKSSYHVLLISSMLLQRISLAQKNEDHNQDWNLLFREKKSNQHDFFLKVYKECVIPLNLNTFTNICLVFAEWTAMKLQRMSIIAQVEKCHTCYASHLHRLTLLIVDIQTLIDWLSTA